MGKLFDLGDYRRKRTAEVVKEELERLESMNRHPSRQAAKKREAERNASDESVKKISRHVIQEANKPQADDDAGNDEPQQD